MPLAIAVVRVPSLTLGAAASSWQGLELLLVGRVVGLYHLLDLVWGEEPSSEGVDVTLPQARLLLVGAERAETVKLLPARWALKGPCHLVGAHSDEEPRVWL